MRHFSAIRLILLVGLFSVGVSSLMIPSARADEYLTTSTYVPKSVTAQDYSQIFTLQAGSFSPRSILINNGDYKFRYDEDALQSYLVQAGWALRLFDFLGGWHVEENLGFTSFSGTADSMIQGQPEQTDLRLNLLSFDSRLMYSMEWFPWKSFIPFVDGGYEYSFYSQTGRSDLESAQGGVGQFVTGAGFRLWLNRGRFNGNDFVAKFVAIPIFLTAKASWIYSNGSSLDLSSQTYFAGVAVAL